MGSLRSGEQLAPTSPWRRRPEVVVEAAVVVVVGAVAPAVGAENATDAVGRRGEEEACAHRYGREVIGRHADGRPVPHGARWKG